MFSSIALLFATLSPVFSAPAATKPAAFFLAGDSTTHTGSGWGDGFINTTLRNGAIGTNYGVSGATTASFRARGTWSTVISAVKSHASSYTPYVTIQFGHNDQKSTSGLTIAQFTANLETFVKDVKSAGGTPILLTPLSRRNFNDGVHVDNLANVRNGTIAAATATGAHLAHLNEKSFAYVSAIGTKSYGYNLADDDYTHLNILGSQVFGALVAKLLIAEVPALSEYLQVDALVSKDLDNGVYYAR